MGRWRALIPVTLALVVSLAASLFLYKRLIDPDANNESKSREPETANVAVAVEDLLLGAIIQPEMIKTAEYLKENLPSGFISDHESLAGRVVIASIRKNEPIVEHRLAPKDVTVGGVSAIIKSGSRAIAVKGDKVIGISGFIRPGNRVDVLVTVEHPGTKLEVTKTVLENILVLATGELMQKSEKDSYPVDVYTLEVTPEEGEKLALAAAEGILQFALRNIADTQNVMTEGVTIPQLLSSFDRPEPKPTTESVKPVVRKPAKSVKRVARRSRLTMEVIKGGKVITKKFKR
jgi:pilus assembly protein CpaB